MMTLAPTAPRLALDRVQACSEPTKSASHPLNETFVQTLSRQRSELNARQAEKPDVPAQTPVNRKSKPAQESKESEPAAPETKNEDALVESASVPQEDDATQPAECDASQDAQDQTGTDDANNPSPDQKKVVNEQAAQVAAVQLQPISPPVEAVAVKTPDQTEGSVPPVQTDVTPQAKSDANAAAQNVATPPAPGDTTGPLVLQPTQTETQTSSDGNPQPQTQSQPQVVPQHKPQTQTHAQPQTPPPQRTDNQPITPSNLSPQAAAAHTDAAASASANTSVPVAPPSTVTPASPVEQPQSAPHSLNNGDDGSLNAARLARGLSGAVSQRGGAVTLRLTPPEMGTVRIQMQITGTQVSVHFHAETEQGQTLLTQQLGQLRQTLEGQGLQVDRISVQTMQPAQSSAANHSGTQQDTSQQRTDSQQHQTRSDDGRSRGSFDRRQDSRQDSRPRDDHAFDFQRMLQEGNER